MSEAFGYLLVHFVEDPLEHKEKIFFSLSEGDDPLAWRRLNGGEAVLESSEGTGGVRDPNIVRGPDGMFHILATDLRVWRPEGPDWWEFRHRGSLDVVIWDSTDLLTWSEPRYVRVAPEGAGMAWAPKSVYDPVSGDFLVFWSSGLKESG
ncbi:MAG: beta-xylosidase, partial [Pseudarthrobacter sp.]